MAPGAPPGSPSPSLLAVIIQDRLTAESRGWIKPSWYWTGIDAGFELWKGGQGLRVSYFNVDS
jgi:hypothetical protein